MKCITVCHLKGDIKMEPNIFTSLSGEKINSRMVWEDFRRDEIIALFEHFVYGERPKVVPDELAFETETVNEDLDGVLIRHIKITLDGFSFTVNSYTPKDAKKVPVFITYTHETYDLKYDIEKDLNPDFMPIGDIVRRGYGVIIMKLCSVYPDRFYVYEHKTGIFTAYPKSDKNRRDSDWASVSAWAYATSRIVDYIETDELFDPERIAVAGHSRMGKTALWSGATDDRIAYVISNSSGCGGAAMQRGKEGEQIEYITRNTDWFNKNYAKYDRYTEMLPVDQHMLLALIAPRYLYIQSSELDTWSDPTAERRSAKLASEVYALYGRRGIVIPEDDEIEISTPYHKGLIGHHTRPGKHQMTALDWDMFIAFWESKEYQSWKREKKSYGSAE